MDEDEIVYSHDDMMFIVGQLAAIASKVDRDDKELCNELAWRFRELTEEIQNTIEES